MSWTDTAGDAVTFVGMVEGMIGFELDGWQRNLIETAFEAYQRGDELQLQMPKRRGGFELLQRARQGSSEALFDVSLIACQLDPSASVRRIVAQHSDELAAIGVRP